MKILLIGNGGRENALAWKIFNSKSFRNSNSKLYNTLGNPGIDKIAETVGIGPSNIGLLKKFAMEEKIDFTVVGPEVALSKGIVDEFEKNDLRIFGPSKKAAEIESSKIFAKDLMFRNKIPTAKYRSFSKDELNEAQRFLGDCSYPIVFKADGLAAGKGVVIALDPSESERILKDFSEVSSINDSFLNFLIEEYLEGEEVSVFAVADGHDYLVLPFSQDHKKIYEGDKGKNTGGMGAIAPIKKFTGENLMDKIKSNIIEPVLKAMEEEGRAYKGCLYCGLIIVNDEPFVIEFNSRFGDPETQAVLPLINSDFLEMLIASSEGRIKNYTFEVVDEYTCCVVLSSKGYPDKFEVGKEIKGLEEVGENCLIFHSGTKFDERRKNILSTGGRVLSVVGVSKKSLEDAANIAYENVERINFENKYFRRDIGFRQMKGFRNRSKEIVI